MGITPIGPEEPLSRRAMNERFEILTTPRGIVAMWFGDPNTVPAGWAICDGQNGTPDLRGRFILGAGGNYSVNAVGGEETHTLTTAEIPNHRHYLVHNSSHGAIIETGRYPEGGDSTYGDSGPYPTSYVGGDQPHNNMPPYYALCYIMKL